MSNSSPMGKMTIREAKAVDAARLNAALRQLSDDLGDAHNASDADILKYGFGALPTFRAVLAEKGADIVGAAMFSPIFSTTRGGPGLYVSDLWALGTYRGEGLGRKLLQAACRASGTETCFLKLAVYSKSTAAQGFYHHLGFQVCQDEKQLILEGKSFINLRGIS